MSRSKTSFGSALLQMEPEGSVIWPLAMCIAGTALLRQVAPDAELAAENRARLGAVIGKAHTSISQAPGYLGD